MKHKFLDNKGDILMKEDKLHEDDLTQYAVDSKLVRNDPCSEDGQVTFLPRGAILRDLIYEHLYRLHIDEEAFFLRTPITLDYNNLAVKSHADLSGEGIYHTKSSGGNLILKHGTIFTQMEIMAEKPIAVNSLPIKMFEIADCHRIEDESKLNLLSRPRQFSMIDMHIICTDISSSKAEAERISRKILEINKEMGLELEAEFTIDNDFMNNDYDWIKNLVKLHGKPVKIEKANPEKKRPINAEYFSSGIEVAAFQIDQGNAEKFKLKLDDGRTPVIMHVSFAGSIERWIYAIMDNIKDNGFPIWLAPEQARIIMSKNNITVDIAERLKKDGFRVTIDDRDFEIEEKRKLAKKAYVPIIIEEANNRFYSEEETINDLYTYLKTKIDNAGKIMTFPVRLSKWPEQFCV